MQQLLRRLKMDLSSNSVLLARLCSGAMQKKKKVPLLQRTVRVTSIFVKGRGTTGKPEDVWRRNQLFCVPKTTKQSGSYHKPKIQSNYADSPAECKAIGFLGSGVGKDNDFLVQKKYCSVFALILEKCLYRRESNPSASPHLAGVREHQRVACATAELIIKQSCGRRAPGHLPCEACSNLSEHRRRLRCAVLIKCVWC